MEKKVPKKKSVTLQKANTPVKGGPVRLARPASKQAEDSKSRQASGGKKEVKTSPVLSNAKANKKGSSTEPQQKIRIKIRAYDHKVIDKSTKQIIEAAEQSGAKVIGPIPLPTSKSKVCVLKSSFVHKDSRDQYEMRIHKRLMDIIKPTPRTIDSLMNLNLPAGVDIEIKM